MNERPLLRFRAGTKSRNFDLVAISGLDDYFPDLLVYDNKFPDFLVWGQLPVFSLAEKIKEFLR